MNDQGLSPREIDFFFESGLFKVLSEPVRLDLLRFLALKGSSDISTIARSFPQDRSVISRHLKLMAEHGLLIGAKEGRNTYYSLNGFAFLKALEDAAGGVRELLRKACPVEYAKHTEAETIAASE